MHIFSDSKLIDAYVFMFLQSDRIGADEDITEDVDVGELEEKRQEKEAQARATILEIVGDLPSADIAPPENVLFVCKLNPVTSDDDLQIIFSRFGKIVRLVTFILIITLKIVISFKFELLFLQL